MSKKRPLLINSYLSYGTKEQLNAHGRALEDRSIVFGTNQSLLKTFKNIYKQFESNEIPNATIQLLLANGNKYNSMTDLEGYYTFGQKTNDLGKLTDTEGWLSYTLSYLQYPENYTINNGNLFSGKMLIPSSRAQYGVISDIDDTILETGVSSRFKWRLLLNTIFKNIDQRIPLDGASEFYQRLHKDQNGLAVNPIFYVSNSPWNLYDYLCEFLKANNFPKGPVLLRDFWTPFDRTPRPSMPHKRTEILNILETYPHLNFVLIGDCGELDPVFYTEIAEEYPNRILAIYLRKVKNKGKNIRAQKIVANFNITPLLLINTSEEAAHHFRSLQITS